MHSGLKSIASVLGSREGCRTNVVPYIYLNGYVLAAITASVFAPITGFHFIMTRISDSEDYCKKSRCHLKFVIR